MIDMIILKKVYTNLILTRNNGMLNEIAIIFLISWFTLTIVKNSIYESGILILLSLHFKQLLF